MCLSWPSVVFSVVFLRFAMVMEQSIKTVESPGFCCKLGWLGLFRAVVRFVLAIALIVAAAAKAVYLSGGAADPGSLLSIRWILASVIVLEMACAAWFLVWANRFPRITLFGGTALFGLFAVMSLRSVLNGESCNCFGSLVTSPVITLAFDLAAITALVFVYRQPTTDNRQPASSFLLALY